MPRLVVLGVVLAVELHGHIFFAVFTGAGVDDGTGNTQRWHDPQGPHDQTDGPKTVHGAEVSAVASGVSSVRHVTPPHGSSGNS